MKKKIAKEFLFPKEKIENGINEIPFLLAISASRNNSILHKRIWCTICNDKLPQFAVK